MYANARGIVTAACNLCGSERTGRDFELVGAGPEDDNGEIGRAVVTSERRRAGPIFRARTRPVWSCDPYCHLGSAPHRCFNAGPAGELPGSSVLRGRRGGRSRKNAPPGRGATSRPVLVVVTKQNTPLQLSPTQPCGQLFRCCREAPIGRAGRQTPRRLSAVPCRGHRIGAALGGTRGCLGRNEKGGICVP